MLSRIKSLCDDQGISLMELHRRLGWPRGTIDRWDTNKPSIEKVMTVAKYFGVSTDYLCDRTKEKQLADEISELSDDERVIIELFRQSPEIARKAVKDLLSVALSSSAAPAEGTESSQ